jgi:2,4-dienoyl-CoA reductase-like NADH-dependent reductase (Old Yellow Enzyme family)
LGERDAWLTVATMRAARRHADPWVSPGVRRSRGRLTQRPHMSHLFTPYALGPLALANRIVVAPMCQYSAEDGSATDWHLAHLGHLALSSAGLLMIEATAVEAIGRITLSCLGLYSDDNERALARVLAHVRRHAPIRVAIQLAHAGRKGSSEVPWRGGQLIPLERGGWTAVAPSALPHAEGEAPPLALDDAGLQRVKQAFVDAARRAQRLRLDAIELHSAHGYLLHQFLSPLSNQRSDRYGGSLPARMRFPLEVFDAVRAAVRASMPVGVRVSATDWVDGGWDLEQCVAYGRALRERGCGWLHVSSGGVSPKQRIAAAPGYQVPFAERLKREVGLPRSGRPHHRARAGRGDHRHGSGRPDRARARDAVQPALAVACRDAARRAGDRAAAVRALPAARPRHAVRRRAHRTALTPRWSCVSPVEVRFAEPTSG